MARLDPVSTADPARAAAAARPEVLAFLNDGKSEEIARAALGDLAAGADTIRRGDVMQVIEYLSNHRSPNILIVDIGGLDLPLSKIHQLAEVCEPGVHVIAIGNRSEIGLYRDLLHAGVSDYIVKPLAAELLRRAVDAAANATGPSAISQKLGKAIAVIGTRGGVGATTVAVNLAWHLANKQGRRVALVDLDLQTGDCGLMLSVKSTNGLREALENSHRIDNLFLERVMTRRGDRLFVLTAEESLRDELHFAPDGIDKLLVALQSEFHYVIIDVPRTPSSTGLRAIELAALRILVADETIRSAREIVRLRSVLGDGRGAQRNLLVINHSGERRLGFIPRREFLGAIEMQSTLAIPPISKMAGAAATYGAPQASRKGPIAQTIEKLANEISGRPAAARTWWHPWR